MKHLGFALAAAKASSGITLREWLAVTMDYSRSDHAECAAEIMEAVLLEGSPTCEQRTMIAWHLASLGTWHR